MMKVLSKNSLFMVAEIKVTYQPKFKISQRPKISMSCQAYEILKAHWDQDMMGLTEQFYILLLNSSGSVLGIKQIASGTANATLVDPKLVFSIALKTFCSGIILAHNHPSQELKPSELDLRLTKQLVEAGRLLDVDVLDHLIMGKHGYYSFRDEELI